MNQRIVRREQKSAVQLLACGRFGLGMGASRTDRIAVNLGGTVGMLGDERPVGGKFGMAVAQIREQRESVIGQLLVRGLLFV